MSDADRDWPASAVAMAAGAAFLRRLPQGARVVVACDRDVDGLTSGLIVARGLERTGRRPVVLVARRGENPHVPSLQRRIAEAEPDALVVTDMGSRAGPIVAGLPTLLLDHHVPDGFPDGAVIVSAHGHPPTAPSGLLALHLVRQVAPVEDLDWLAVLATFADLGDAPEIPGLREGLRRHGRTHVARAVALLNAARRAPVSAEQTALAVLRAAASPADIARGRIAGVDELRRLQQEVAEELRRCGRAAPRFSGEVALVRCSSAAQVHPLLAARWRQRLARYIVLVANDGFLPGRVNFAARTRRADIDLVAWLRALARAAGGDFGDEIGHGHAAAAGGSVTPQQFARLLRALGFIDVEPALHLPRA